MRLSQTQEAGRAPRLGGARFIPAHRCADTCAELKARRYVIARVAPLRARDPLPDRGSAPPPRLPAGLRAAIEEAVESALALRGALPPGVSVHADLPICIRDQMLRVNALGAAGLVIALPRLGVPGQPPILEAEDSAVLSAWLLAAQQNDEPVTLLFDEQDRNIQVLTPIPIEVLAHGSAGSRAAANKPEMAAAVVGTTWPSAGNPVAESAPPEQASIPQASIVLPESACGGALADEQSEPEPATRPAARQLHRAPPTVPAPAVHEIAPPLPPEPVPGDPSAAERLLTAAEWRAYAMDLDNARGPKPHSVIDRLFITRYMPLLGAIARGQADAMVRGVVDTFRSNFVHSYIESFPALRVTGKRPPMVLDAPDIAARMGRLNGARTVRLLLVDSLRYDLGERVAARLAHRLSGHAVCVERSILWAALPTTTPVQVALLARGSDGLRDPPIESDAEPDILRGRAVTMIRRERVGTREVMKLDLVEARLRGAGPAFDDRFDRIAAELSELVGRFLESLAPRTLVYVFGDHGFCMPSEPHSTGPATQGGASPEEVLVPGYGWLVGGMH